MSLYNFSSVNSAAYNTLRVTLPNHFLTQYVNLSVTTFTCNCNIEVMNDEDYITFKIGHTLYKVYMEQYSKLDTASLPHILEDRIKIVTDKITVSMTNIDTIKFICKESFEITDMSYNMKLLTGYYCTKDAQFPIKSTTFEDKESIIKDEDKDIKAITYHPLNLGVGDYLPLEKTIDPPDANGWTVEYSGNNLDVAVVDENGYVTGVGAGETEVTVEVRNPNSSKFVTADFICKVKVTVAEKQEVNIESVDVPSDISLIETETMTIHAKVSPFYAKREEEIWVSDNPNVATVNNGYIRAISPGTTVIHYQLKNKQQLFNKDIRITVKSQYATITKYQIISDTVGYMLSTPILYLLTNIGNSVFFNEIHDQHKMQCGTVCMCMNNSYASSMPIVATQGDIVTKCAITATSDIFFTLVDANMRPVKLLNPFYITVSIRPDEDIELIQPGILKQ